MKKLNLFSYEADLAEKSSLLGVPRTPAKPRASPQATKIYKVKKVTAVEDKVARAKFISKKVNEATKGIN